MEPLSYPLLVEEAVAHEEDEHRGGVAEEEPDRAHRGDDAWVLRGGGVGEWAGGRAPFKRRPRHSLATPRHPSGEVWARLLSPETARASGW